MANTTQTEILNALRSIVEITDSEFVVTSKEAAEELSQFIMDNGGNGSMTGPFVNESYNHKPVTHFTTLYWYVEK